jgi:hypothetical protein
VNARVIQGELQGHLGTAEQAALSQQSHESRVARERHTVALAEARRARLELQALLAAGVPASREVDAAHAHGTVAQLINTLVYANQALASAAALVCNVEHLPELGIKEGIEWTVTL